jgi:hypothetical protein
MRRDIHEARAAEEDQRNRSTKPDNSFAEERGGTRQRPDSTEGANSHNRSGDRTARLHSRLKRNACAVHVFTEGATHGCAETLRYQYSGSGANTLERGAPSFQLTAALGIQVCTLKTAEC